ncbi:ras gtpase-activating protein [Anaeramoeba flamelloides]|uniref:Ras gtpase-activating protein n=1 Tax=Anaeramoeba flamelloides TaxID=1746091 RepID=A0ABQ8Y216_9EUKA|nr:ras gtpase-activating protein [Anaeramoeba flamelloides]
MKSFFFFFFVLSLLSVEISCVGTGLTEQCQSDVHYYSSFSPEDILYKNGWDLLENAATNSPTMKYSEPQDLSQYDTTAAQTRVESNNPDRSFILQDFGFDLPPVPRSSLLIDDITFSSTRDSYKNHKKNLDDLGYDWVWDGNLYFRMQDTESNSINIEVIRSGSRSGDYKMQKWGDSTDVVRFRDFGGSLSTITSQALATGINRDDFLIDGNILCTTPELDTEDPTSWPNGYRWDSVIGAMNLTVKYSYTIEIESIFPEEGAEGDIIRVNMASGSVIAERAYEGMTVKWWCNINGTVDTAHSINVEDSYIECMAPSGNKGYSASVEVSFYEDAHSFTGSDILYEYYSGCINNDQCENDGVCNTNNICECVEGYYGEYCSKLTCPDDKCDHGTCLNKTGECICDDMYGGVSCDLNLCEEDYDNCTYPQGTCDYSGKNGFCVCDKEEGWTGSDCNTRICDTINCGENYDPPRGKCSLNGVCDCFPNYSGSNCQYINCIEGTDKCNNGVCLEEDGSCECEKGYTGTYCDYYLCDAIECKNGGECIVETGQCKCATGFTGATCQSESESNGWFESNADKMGLSTGGFIAFFVGMLLIGGVLLGLLLFFVSKKLSERDRYSDILCLPIYDLQTLFGDGFSVSDNEISRLRKSSTKKDLFDLQELLLENLDFVNCLCIAAETKVADYLGKSLLYIFESNGDSPAIMKYFIEKEINECDDGDLLFRGYSMASKLWTSFCHLACAIEYLHRTLSQPIYDLLKDQEKLEVELDPDQVKEIGAQSANKYNLMAASESFLSAIVSHSDDIPPSFRFILSTTRQLLEQKFPDRICQAIGGMMILRYFVPAITACDDYGIIAEEPSDTLFRTLILIAKVLMNLANGTLFGVKEEYMATLNDFINENQDRVNQYLLEISTPTEESMDELAFENSPLPQDVLEISTANVHRYMTLNSETIIDVIDVEIEDPDRSKFLIKEMQTQIFKIGDPIDITADEDV